MTQLGQVTSLTLTDSGEYYTFLPTVAFLGGFPEADSSKPIKFGDNSLDMHEHSYTFAVDSVDTSMNGFLAFWLWVDSAALPDSAGSNMKPLWEMGVNDNGASRRRFGVDNLGRIKSTNKHINANTITTWENQGGLNDSDRILENRWNHVIFSFAGADQGFATRRAEVMINGTRVYYTNSTSFAGFFHDSDILFGAQLSGPYGIGSVVFDSPSGMYMDNLYLDSGDASFLLGTEKTALFDNDSANGNWFSNTLAKFQNFDNDSAEAYALIDSSDRKVSQLVLTYGGQNYISAPTMVIREGSAIDSAYNVGDTVEQTLSNNVKITGEIQIIQNDSAGDSDIHMFLAHVGADDGLYHTFNTTSQLINKTLNNTNGLDVIAVSEDNKISGTEQNEVFTTQTVDDFLDFTENNPFGDPENQ